jgi:hypothetical protein
MWSSCALLELLLSNDNLPHLKNNRSKHEEDSASPNNQNSLKAHQQLASST